jgi:hypothetical protein
VGISRLLKGTPRAVPDNGDNSLNIIFIETLRKMEFDFNKMTACDEPF